MKWKLSRKQVIVSIILFLVYLCLSSNIVFGESLIVSGRNFKIYFPSNTGMTFQHLKIPFSIDAFNVTLMVQSGLLNGSEGSLTMWSGSGKLKFTSQNAFNLSASASSSKVSINVNGKAYSDPVSIQANDVVIIHWVTTSWSPIGLIMGLIGLIILIVTPTYTVYEVKKKKNYMMILYAFILLAIGYGFLVGWLT